MISKKLFVDTLNSIQKQRDIDREFSDGLGKVFKEVHSYLLKPNTDTITDALIVMLQHVMNDVYRDEYGNTWITYFIYELDFGAKNSELKVTQDGIEVPMYNAGHLYDYLISKRRF